MGWIWGLWSEASPLTKDKHELSLQGERFRHANSLVSLWCDREVSADINQWGQDCNCGHQGTNSWKGRETKKANEQAQCKSSIFITSFQWHEATPNLCRIEEWCVPRLMGHPAVPPHMHSGNMWCTACTSLMYITLMKGETVSQTNTLLTDGLRLRTHGNSYLTYIKLESFIHLFILNGACFLNDTFMSIRELKVSLKNLGVQLTWRCVTSAKSDEEEWSWKITS